MNEIGRNGIDEHGNGLLDDVNGWDSLDEDSDPGDVDRSRKVRGQCCRSFCTSAVARVKDPPLANATAGIRALAFTG